MAYHASVNVVGLFYINLVCWRLKVKPQRNTVRALRNV